MVLYYPNWTQSSTLASMIFIEYIGFFTFYMGRVDCYIGTYLFRMDYATLLYMYEALPKFS